MNNLGDADMDAKTTKLGIEEIGLKRVD